MSLNLIEKNIDTKDDLGLLNSGKAASSRTNQSVDSAFANKKIRREQKKWEIALRFGPSGHFRD